MSLEEYENVDLFRNFRLKYDDGGMYIELQQEMEIPGNDEAYFKIKRRDSSFLGCEKANLRDEAEEGGFERSVI